MIHELEPSCCSRLNIDCPFPEARAVMAGNNPGWVFVDEPNAPRAAVVWAQGMKGFYLVGDPDTAVFREELAGYSDEILIPRLRSMGVDWFEISGHAGRDALIEHVFGARRLESSQQWIYRSSPRSDRSVPPTGSAGRGRLVRVDAGLLEASIAGDKSLLPSKVQQFWGSDDKFLDLGLGYALLVGEEVVSLCFTGFVTEDTYVVEIETVAAHRRKGHAETVARAFLDESMARNRRVHWDCMAENTASARLAEKVGLMHSGAYTLYSFPLFG
jgi:hypothetical protein